ncbi:MAG: hypothetical protein H0T73_21795, partial [Ardenticatenales bacterium]|nr:hypothetical protein [Ardenticatenales bacterium]
MASWEVPGYLEAREGVLHMEGLNATGLAAQHGTPLFLFSERKLRENIAEIRRAFQGFLLPSRLFYASKANSNLAILQLVRESGIDVEVNSGGELYKVLAAGFQPEQIIFNGVAKREEELRYAIEQQIYCINVDSAYELSRVLKMARQLKQRAAIALRMVPEVWGETHGGIETGTQNSKFGIAQEELLDCYRAALRYPAALFLRGLHMHIGAQIENPAKHEAGFKALLRAAATLRTATGYLVPLLNMGGGLPVSFLKEENPALPSPATVAESTVGLLEEDDFRQELEALSPGICEALTHCTLAVEPGTRIVANSAILLTTVENHKTRPATGDSWLLLDAGFNTLLDTLAYNWYFHILAATNASSPATTPYKLGGPLCDSGDIFHDSEGLGRLPDHRFLPASLGPGDLLAFLDVGGYTLEQMCT